MVKGKSNDLRMTQQRLWQAWLRERLPYRVCLHLHKRWINLAGRQDEDKPLLVWVLVPFIFALVYNFGKRNTIPCSRVRLCGGLGCTSGLEDDSKTSMQSES